MAARDQQPASVIGEEYRYRNRSTERRSKPTTRIIMPDQRVDGSTHAKTEKDHPQVIFPAALGGDDSQFEQRHPDQHHSGHVIKSEAIKNNGLETYDFFHPPFEQLGRASC